MLVSEIIAEVNSLADDQIEDNRVIAWINDALMAVGSEVGATFPAVLVADDLNPILPVKWQRLLVKVYATARLKQQDSSQFEYQDLYSQFIAHLGDYAAIKDVVKIDYRDLLPGSEITVNGVAMTVESGDTLYQIAQDEGTTVQALINENPDVLKFSGEPAEPSFEDNWYRWDSGW